MLSLMKILSGVPASQGIVAGKAFIYLEGAIPEPPRYQIEKNQVETEWKRFHNAVETVINEAEALFTDALQEMHQNQADILATHIAMLQDIEFTEQIRARVEKTFMNIESVLLDVSQEFTQKLIISPDTALQERASDISDITKRLLHSLMSIEQDTLSTISEDVILVAHDLLPSEIMVMNRKRVKGIATDLGSKTSHTAILAQSLGIPAVLGLSCATKEISAGDTLIIQGNSGEVIINPISSYITQMQQDIGTYQKRLDALQELRELPTVTLDGRLVSLRANIELPYEVEQAISHGAEGIGLFRSEFLFIDPSLSTDEEAQYQVYRQVAATMGDLPVTIRTIDIGGDKALPTLQAMDEKNPLLGWRAIRFSLSRPDIFKAQLRAILRASVSKNLQIMFPMISGIEELIQAKAIFEEAKEECRAKNQPFAEDIQLGIMVEIPSAAITADILAKESDFFSIGTNDLMQYTLAVDRNNENVNYLAQPFHPAILRTLRTVFSAAQEQGIPVALCGELARMPRAVPLLLGMGLNEFSMTPVSIPLVKRIIRSLNYEDCKRLAAQALECTSYIQVGDLLDQWMIAQQLNGAATDGYY